MARVTNQFFSDSASYSNGSSCKKKASQNHLKVQPFKEEAGTYRRIRGLFLTIILLRATAFGIFRIYERPKLYIDVSSFEFQTKKKPTVGKGDLASENVT